MKVALISFAGTVCSLRPPDICCICISQVLSPLIRTLPVHRAAHFRPVHLVFNCSRWPRSSG